jgi:hypothetical protein
MMTPYVTNVTPFQALAITHGFYNGHLYDCLFVKATFRLGHDGRLLPMRQQPAFEISDVYEGKEDFSALALASEIIAYKPATDVVVTGHARPAGGRPVDRWLAHLEVSGMAKTIQLTGPRMWRYGVLSGWALSPIVPASGVRLSYALAFGGASATRRESAQDIHWPNPFGRGAFGRDKPNPNLEYPAAQILPANCREPRWDQPVESVGLSFVDGQQQARLQYSGTYDEAWRKNVAPHIPLDMRMEYWNTVPQDQVVKPYLKGGEEVITLGLFPTPDGSLRFRLPVYDVFAVPIRGDTKEYSQPMYIDTLHIDLDRKRVVLRWATLYSRSQGYDEYNVVAIAQDQRAPAIAKVAA